jgi:hypothetical protein
MFTGANNLVAVNAEDAPTINSGTSLNTAFLQAVSLTTISNLENWNWSNVTTVVELFRNCSISKSTATKLPGLVVDNFRYYSANNQAYLYYPGDSTSCFNCEYMLENENITNTEFLDWFVSLDFSGLISAHNFCGSIPTSYYETLLAKFDADGATNVDADFVNTVRTATAQTTITALKAKGWTGSDDSGAW